MYEPLRPNEIIKHLYFNPTATLMHASGKWVHDPGSAKKLSEAAKHIKKAIMFESKKEERHLEAIWKQAAPGEVL